MKNINKNSIIKIIIGIAVIAIVIFGIKLIMGISSGGEKDVASGYDTIPIEANEAYDFGRCGNNIVMVKNNGTYAYSDKLVSKWSIESNGTNPFIRSNGDRAIIYYMNEKVALITDGKSTQKVETEGEIACASINENGYFCIVTGETGYKSLVTVYAPDCEVIYKWHSAENYVVDAEVSPNNKSMTVATIDFSKSSVSGGVMMFNFTQEKPHVGHVLENSIVMDIAYVSKSRVVAVSDTGFYGYNAIGEKVFDVPYGNMKLTSFNINSPNNMVLVFSKDGSVVHGSVVKVYKASGKEYGVFESDETVTGVDVVDRKIMLTLGRKIKIISRSGNEKKTFNLNKDIKSALLFENKRSAFVVSGSSAERINLR